MKTKHAGWIRVLLIIIPYVIVIALFQFLGILTIGIDPTQGYSANTTFEQFVLSAFSFAGTLLVVWIFIRFVEKHKFMDAGFELKGQGGELFRGIWIGVVLMVVGFLVLYAFKQLTVSSANFNVKEIALTIGLFILVAITEELLLRGYVLRNLMISFNKYVALLVSAILFSLMHAFNPDISTIGLINIFLAGILLGITYIHTQNLWFPIGLHFSWNLLQSWLGFNVSGNNSYSILDTSLTQENLFNGGSFGFEASILASIFECIAIVALAIYYHKKTTVISLDE